MLTFLRTLTRQIRAHPVSSFFLITGFTISILLISFGVSSSTAVADAVSEKKEYIPKYSSQMQITFKKDYEAKNFNDFFEGLSDKTGIISKEGLVPFVNNADNELQIDGYYSFGKYTKIYPIKEGRFFDAEDIEKSNHVVIIGKNIKKYLNKMSNEDYLKIEGVDYKLIGVISGSKNDELIDNKIIVPLTSIPDKYKKENLKKNRSLIFNVYNNFNPVTDDVQKIQEHIKKYDANADINASPNKNNEDPVLDYYLRNDVLWLAVIVYLLALINSVNLTSFWVKDRKIEIGIRKAFGYSNLKISLLLFKELVILAVFSCLISFLIQFIINLFVNSISGFSTKLNIENYITAIIFVFFTSLITVIIPSVKTLSIQPVEAIK